MEAKMARGKKRQDGEKQHSERAARKVTATERAAIQRRVERNAGRPSIRFKVSKNESGCEVGFDHADEIVGHILYMDAVGSADWDFACGIMKQLAKASCRGNDADEEKLNFMLSVIKGIEPRDQTEAMLAAQMASVHVAAMNIAARLIHAERISEQDSNERAFNKLTRTFAMQVEALKRYRTGAEQKVTLQHVSVAEGGQAIVGNVTQASRENGPEKAATAQPAPVDTNVVPMPIVGKSREDDSPAMRRKSNK
jgi:hypothetical protein